jgi:hypothetical protein
MIEKESIEISDADFETLRDISVFIDKHGSIKRAEAAELCRIGNDQAYRLLKRLKNSGLIVQKGQAKARLMCGSVNQSESYTFSRATCILRAPRVFYAHRAYFHVPRRSELNDRAKIMFKRRRRIKRSTYDL